MTLAPVLQAVEFSGPTVGTDLRSVALAGSSKAAFERWRDHLCTTTFQDVAKLSTSAPDFLLPPLIARGALTLLTGAPKLGKTRFVLSLLKAALEGREFLGVTQKPVKALYMSEMDPKGFGLYLNRYGLDGSPFLFEYFIDAPAVPWEMKVEAVFTQAKKAEVDLVVFDTVLRWAGTQDEEVNSYGSMNAALWPLIKAKASGVAVLAVHHDRKAGGSPGSRALGSVAVTGSVDDTISLSAVPNAKGRYLLTASGRNIGAPRPIYLTEDPATIFSSYIPPSSVSRTDSEEEAAFTPTTSIQGDILEAVGNLGSATYSRVKKELDRLGKVHAPRTLKRALRNMKDAKCLVSSKDYRPRYSLPAENLST